MAFLGASGPTTKTTTSQGTGFLNAPSAEETKVKKNTKLAQEAQASAAEANKANSIPTLAKETLFGIPKVLQGAGKAVLDPITTTLGTPIIRAEQATAALAGKAIGGDFGKRLENQAYEPMPAPSLFGGEQPVIAPQKAFGEGGGTQIAGDTLKYAATVYPGTSLEKAAGSVFLGDIGKAAAEGAVAGGVTGAAYSGGDSLSRGDSAMDVLKQTAIGGGVGLGLGGLLGAGGAMLALPAARKAAAEAEATRLRPLPVQDENIRPGMTRANTRTVPEENIRRITQLPVVDESGRARNVPINRAQEPHIPEDQLPIIKMGPAAPRSAATGPDFRYEPIEAPKTQPKATPEAPVTSVAKQPAARVATSMDIPPQGKPVTMDIPKKVATVPVREPKAGEPTTTAKAATDVNKKLAAAGFDQVDEELLPSITSINKEDQVKKVGMLLQDRESSIAMAAGHKPVPDGVAPQVLFNAVKNRAIEEADGETLALLARSKIAAERSQAAQTLGSAGFNNGPADAVDAIREIESTRVKAAERRKQPSDVKKEAKAIKDSIKQVQAKQSWDDVVNSLTC